MGATGCRRGLAGSVRVRPGHDRADAYGPVHGHLEALFRFYATKSNPGVPEGCFEMAGTYDPGTQEITLTAGRWRLHPPSYVTVDLSGAVSQDGRTISGTVTGPLCTRFELRRIPEVSRSATAACRGYEATVSSTVE